MLKLDKGCKQVEYHGQSESDSGHAKVGKLDENDTVDVLYRGVSSLVKVARPDQFREYQGDLHNHLCYGPIVGPERKFV